MLKSVATSVRRSALNCAGLLHLYSASHAVTMKRHCSATSPTRSNWSTLSSGNRLEKLALQGDCLLEALPIEPTRDLSDIELRQMLVGELRIKQGEAPLLKALD